MREEEEAGIFIQEVLKAKAQLRDSSAVNLRKGCTIMRICGQKSLRLRLPQSVPHPSMAVVSQLLCAGELVWRRPWEEPGEVRDTFQFVFCKGGLGSAGLTTGFNDLRGPFQPKQFYDLCQVCSMLKTQTSAGVWWPHAELVRGECYLAMCPVPTNTSHVGKVLCGAQCDPCVLMQHIPLLGVALNVSLNGGMAHPKAGTLLLCFHSWYKSAIGMQSLPLTPPGLSHLYSSTGDNLHCHIHVLHCSAEGLLKPQMSLCQAFCIRMAEWSDYTAPQGSTFRENLNQMLIALLQK